MKYAFIEQHRRLWPVSVQCRVLHVSAAGCHAHLVRRGSDAQRRPLNDEALLVHIKALHAETCSAYGWPRIWRELVACGVAVGKQPVQKLMQLHGLLELPPFHGHLMVQTEGVRDEQIPNGVRAGVPPATH